MEKVTDTLRKAIVNSKKSRYAISKQTGIAESALSRFMSGERGLNCDSVNALAEFFRLELRPQRKRKAN